jgi:F-type H+-transporting ATPase subunit b
MRKLLATAAAVLALALPSLAFAAERAGEPRGSWFFLIFFAINFALFAFIVVYFAAPHTRRFFGEHSAEIRGVIGRAESAFAEASAMVERAKARLAGLEAEKARLEAELKDETAHLLNRIRDIAERGVDRIRRDAELTSAAMAESAQRRLRARLAASAAQIARGLIERNFQTADQSRLVTDFVDKLKEEARP